MALPTTTIIGNISFMELKYGQDGKPRMSFVIGASEKGRDGNWQNLNIGTTVFGKTAEFINQYFKDGDAIIATGKLIEEKWVSQDGSKRSKIKLLFPDVSFVPKQKGDTQQPQQSNYQQQQNSSTQQQQQPQTQYNQPQQQQTAQSQYGNPNNPPQQPVPMQDLTEQIPF